MNSTKTYVRAACLALLLVCRLAQASPTNDMFAAAAQLNGTNLTFSGNLSGATLEPNEPAPSGTNTVWASWVAPYTGRANFQLAATACNVFTGPAVDQLQPVPAILYNTVYSFLAIEGTVYNFQFSGGTGDFSFSFSVSPLLPATNDNFADAQVVKGTSVNFQSMSVLGATMEPGEPAHMGPVPQKSIWWKWQAPASGMLNLASVDSLVPTVFLAVYTGDSVGALTLVGKATNALNAFVIGGQTYHIAGAVDTNAVGDIFPFGTGPSYCATSRIIPGNLLQEPSWEGTAILNAQHWHWSGSLGGYVNETGGADGTTWPALSQNTIIWQDISTIPGHAYDIQFAYKIGGCCGDAQVQVGWDSNIVGVADIPATESGFWHWTDFVVTASNTTSRVSFQNLAAVAQMDAFSVLDLQAPPVIVTQPSSISTVAAGTAEFAVAATGSAPLQYQWFFNTTALAGETHASLVLNGVSTNQAGSYMVTISNCCGAVTSAVVSLSVDSPQYPTIVWEPYGDTVTPGAYFSFNVAAIGPAPLQYQWFLNGAPIAGATSNKFTLTSVSINDAGVYQVTVQNPAGTVWSLPATLRIGDVVPGGGQLLFDNKAVCGGTPLAARIFDTDGLTPLSGPTFLGQLYAGPSLELLRPAGQPVPFRTGFFAGYVTPQPVTLANVAPGSNAVAQVRAWDASVGDTYEAARALGGRFGKSGLLNLTLPGGNPPPPPQCLTGLQSFSLQAGLPQFTVGIIQFVERRPGGIVVWSLTGQAGFLYLIEKAKKDFVWRPYTVVTNTTGTATFTDSANSGSAVTFYRARILD